MSPPPTNPYDGITKADFDTLSWPQIIATIPLKECHEYAKRFAERAKELEDERKTNPARAARVLMAIASFGFHPSESDRPFHPEIIWDNRRTPLPKDFPDELITLIASLVPTAADPEFAARLGDVALIGMPKRDGALLAITIENYLASGTNLFRHAKWNDGYLRFRRAVHLIQKPSPALSSTLKVAFDRFLTDIAPSCSMLQVVQMLELYPKHLSGDPVALAGHATHHGKKAEEAKEWHLFRRLSTLHSFWLHKQNKEAEAKAALYRAAETHVSMADEAMQRPTPSPLAAADHLLRATTAHRDIEKDSLRAAELDGLRADYQRQGIRQMQWVNLAEQPDADSLRVAITTAENALRMAASDAARAAQGLPFHDAHRMLALCHPPPDKERLEAIAVEELHNCVWTALIPITLLDEEGRPFVKAGSFLHSNAEGQRLIIEQRMLTWFKTYHIPETVTIFEAIRDRMNDEHNITPEHVESIIAHSSFIPNGREYLFMRGLFAGLIGDFVLAGHFLAPQLEHAIKVHLQLAGVIPTVTEASETERAADLNFLFGKKRKEIEAIFGVDETFELEALLIRRWGCHLRNYIAHGQLNPWQFYEPPGRYLWWITLRLCMFGAAPLPKPKAMSSR